MSRLISFVLFYLLLFSGPSAQTISKWQTIGAAGGMAGETQNGLKSMAGFVSGGIADDGSNIHWSGLRFDISLVLDVKNDINIPTDFVLYQNYPNPFNPSTKIDYSLAQRSKVSLTIYNILGQRVIKLVSEEQEAGIYSVNWDGFDKNGNESSSGIYLYKIEAANFTKVKKMVLLK